MITSIEKYKVIYEKFEQYCKKSLDDLNEGLISTMQPMEAWYYIRKECYGFKIEIEVFDDKPYLNQAFAIDDTFKNQMRISIDEINLIKFKSIQAVINRSGYFIARAIDNIENKIYLDNFEKLLDFNAITIELIIEAKFDVSIDLELLKNTYFYHLTEESKRNKIFSIGLVPKAKNKLSSHPERIYFETNEFKIPILAAKLNIKNPLVLEINKDEVKNLKLYQDPNYSTGIYTMQNIPPNFIKEYV